MIKSIVERNGLDGKEVDEVIMGNTLQAGLVQNPAKIAGINAGLRETVSAMTVNKFCGSGLKVVQLAY